MNVEIDKKSGFCFGVIKAIRKAEEALDAGVPLYSLGEIVHNGIEVGRLEKKGMKTISLADFPNLRGATVLIRAHGEPPVTYELAKQYDIQLIDATCPVVLQLQDKIRNAYAEMKNENAQLVIYGREGHAEVNGLTGQVSGDAVVVENVDQIQKLDLNRPVLLFSQTTKSMDGYKKLSEEIRKRIPEDLSVITHDTICNQVSHRAPGLRLFALNHDVTIFVSGKSSSNGKSLYSNCLENNARSYMIESKDELRAEWFDNCSSVGICGATSTPRWLMEEIAQAVEQIAP